ncbi:uracil-DNA glycosylase [Flavobacterium capsici]|uniref:Uracil-DNA glycosylase n=1 Tax=Flavobacterium capsici TaxID=3075618 RepID=A0AA96EYH1_9FLAO|nr:MULTISPECIES: uracil-DNA glycosylase [unclassified Flavobacterium]WNM17921.1 uracil-DNA glycosylase [Flavobacterium sp. PMR2A8]WNM21973.1 uracil-DNA glycosylase [Flavobacterium sp. PMTSA4]
MQFNIKPSWQDFLASEFEKSYFVSLLNSLDEEYENYICFPPKELIFNAFNQFDVNELKVVIIGQDPYHGVGEANGLCFSVNDGVKIPPSLRNIFTEINTEFDRLFFPSTGNLEHWAKQGVLLLNATMTVRKDSPNSHKNLDWQIFTDAVIEKISKEKEQIVFLLWGSFAQKKAELINKSKHLVLESGHPSFASVHKKWFGNNHFIKTNEFLLQKGKQIIEW